MRRLAVVAILSLQVVLACKCVETVDPSQAYARSDVVFSGRLEAMEPMVLGWPAPDMSAIRRKFKRSEEELEKLMEEDSPEALPLQKEILTILMGPRYKYKIEAAGTIGEARALADAVITEGVRARFRVEEMWKGTRVLSIDIWQQVSSCSVYFPRSETVLVYAWHDEKGRLTTQACSRGGPISNAGDDLVYLYFVKRQPRASTRLFGFVTTDETDLKRPRMWRDVPHPGEFLTLQLESGGKKRYAASSSKGTFVVDGLAEGEYSLTIYKDDVPDARNLVKGPLRVRVPARGFVTREIYIPKELLNKP